MFQPRSDQVLIEIQEIVKDESGIILPDTVKHEHIQQGIVIAVGPGKHPGTIEVTVGNQVILPKYAGAELIIDDKDYVVVQQHDILAVMA